LNFYTNAATRYGFEGGIMEGESSENRYKLGRMFLFWDGPFGAGESWFMSSDMLFIQYDEDIYGKDYSCFMSLGGGKHLLDDTLQLAICSHTVFADNHRLVANQSHNVCSMCHQPSSCDTCHG
jgi:hypothetical protein